jgi:peptidoglycan hydrolase FlgJ
MEVSSVRNAVPPRDFDTATFRASNVRTAKSPLVQFEAFVLQEFVSAMLPKEAASVYGKGLSGEMWQSMFAEKIAAQLAESGGIGIADRLLKDFHVEGEERLALQGVSDPQLAVTKSEANGLAKAMLNKTQTDVFGVSATIESQKLESNR